MLRNRHRSCAFCGAEGFAQRVVFSNRQFTALVARSPLVPGHLIIVPKRHRFDLDALTAATAPLLISTLNRAMAKLRAGYSAEGFNILINIDSSAGQTVPHLHVHLLPRRAKEKRNPLELTFGRTRRSAAGTPARSSPAPSDLRSSPRRRNGTRVPRG